MSGEFPVSIKNLIKGLESLKIINNKILIDVVSENRIKSSDLKLYEMFEHCPKESYGRMPIYDNGNFKILLMSWKAGDFTAIHNHGYTEWGCVYFLGDATHRLYSVENNELKVIQKDDFYNGQIAPVCGDLTHMMGNAGKSDFTTLHIYGSSNNGYKALEDARIYYPEFKKMVTTMGSAFLNIKKDLILEERPFDKFDNETLNDYYQLVKPFYERNNLTDVLEIMQF